MSEVRLSKGNQFTIYVSRKSRYCWGYDRQLPGQAHRAVCFRATGEGILWLRKAGRDTSRPTGSRDELG